MTRDESGYFDVRGGLQYCMAQEINGMALRPNAYFNSGGSDIRKRSEVSDNCAM